jgi:hypothetical protein
MNWMQAMVQNDSCYQELKLSTEEFEEKSAV